ncbi:helix-turn-helix domain-containing protein [Ruminococcaceae bacterium OttesenSCG-928-I18]|nr:helix-turn-helix domain-containing protein [Ruminococcaceae bacterium OttesenSCG-928-I18]
MDDIQKRIRALMDELNMSYGELSDKTKIPKSALQRYVTGTTIKIPIDRVESIAKSLEVTPEYLMGWDSDPNQQLQQAIIQTRAEELRKQYEAQQKNPPAEAEGELKDYQIRALEALNRVPDDKKDILLDLLETYAKEK